MRVLVLLLLKEQREVVDVAHLSRGHRKEQREVAAPAAHLSQGALRLSRY